jgi:hypothetical protein
MKEYKIAKGWAIFIYIAAPLLIALFVWMFMLPFIEVNENSEVNKWILCPIALVMIVLMVLGVIDAYKGKFVIDKDRIYAVGIFSTKQLYLDAIKGFRITDKYIFIEAKNPLKKTIKVSTYYRDSNEIIGWLYKHYDDLDVVTIIEETEEILSNEVFGFTQEQRESELKKARKVAKLCNWGGGILCIWAIAYPKPYNIVMSTCIAYPLVCLFVLKYFKGLIRVDEKTGTAYPSLFLAIFISGSALCLRALVDYHIYDISRVWVPAIIIAILFITMLHIDNKEFNVNKAKDNIGIVGLYLFMFGYGFAAVVSANCVFDASKPEIFKATILEKHKSSGKRTTYYLKLSPWGKQENVDEVSVPSNLYYNLDANDTVTIYFMKGKFDIPWFEVTE